MCNDFYKLVMGQPTVSREAGNCNSSGDNTLVAAPGAGYCLVLLYVYVQNETANETVTILKHGSTGFTRSTLGQYISYERDYSLFPCILGEDEALVLDLSGANEHAFIVDYVITAV